MAGLRWIGRPPGSKQVRRYIRPSLPLLRPDCEQEEVRDAHRGDVPGLPGLHGSARQGTMRAACRGGVPVYGQLNRGAAGKRENPLPARSLVQRAGRGADASIAAQRYISVRVGGSRLDQIRNRTGRRLRADLTRLALTAGAQEGSAGPARRMPGRASLVSKGPGQPARLEMTMYTRPSRRGPYPRTAAQQTVARHW